MSPLRRPLRAPLLLVLPLLLALAATGVQAAEPGAPPTRVVTIGVIDEGCPAEQASPCWDTPRIVVRPGDNVSIVADLTTSNIPHNIWVREGTETDVEDVAYHPAATAAGKLGTAERPKTLHYANFTVPDDYDGTYRFVCTVHPTSMVGEFVLPEAALAGGEHAEPIHHLGVNFLSYWVGLIAFMLLFIVYGATFFLFKYNETPATTDHWERAGEGAPDFKRRFSPAVASLLAVVLAAVVIGGVIYLARLS